MDATYQESLLSLFRSWDCYAVLAEGGRTRALSGTTGILGQRYISTSLLPSPVSLTGHRFSSRQAYRHTLRLAWNVARNVAILLSYVSILGTASVCFPDVADSMTKLSTKLSWVIDRAIDRYNTKKKKHAVDSESTWLSRSKMDRLRAKA
jgi:hypothetical protein